MFKPYLITGTVSVMMIMIDRLEKKKMCGTVTYDGFVQFATWLISFVIRNY